MAITVVQTASGGTTGSSVSVSFTDNVTSGNCVIAAISDYADTHSGNTISSVELGSSADNWVAAKASQSQWGAAIWVDPDSAGGNNTVNITLANSATSCHVDIYEISGLAASSVTDKTSSSSGTGTSYTSGTTGTTTQAHEFWVGTTSGLINTFPSGWTELDYSCYDIVSSTGTATFSGTLQTTADWDAVVVTLLPATNITVNLVTATVAIAAPAPSLQYPVTVDLVTATVTITANPVTPGQVENLIASVAAESGTDDYGNAFQSGFTVYDGSSTYIQVHVNSTVGAPAIDMPTGAGSEAYHGSVYTNVGNKGEANEEINLWVVGPGSTDDDKQAAIALTSSAKNGSTAAAGELIFFTPTETTVALWNGSGFTVNSGTLTAGTTSLGSTSVSSFTDTGNATVDGTLTVDGAITATGGTQSSPTLITTDTWHDVTPATGFSLQSGEPMQYRLRPDGDVEINGALTCSSGTAESTKTIFTLPSGYQPNRSCYFPIAVYPYTSANYGMTLYGTVNTSGAVSIVFPSTSTITAIIIGAQFPLTSNTS